MRARDPRSFRELRQLARQAQRNPDALEVLQDALLETLPAYQTAIARADALSQGGRSAWNVWFFPTRLNPITRKYGTTHLAFEEHPAFIDRDDLRLREPRVAHALVVYETVPTKYLVYRSEGDGRGEVVDRRDGRVMGRRYLTRGGQGSQNSHWGVGRHQSVGALDAAFLRWMRWRLTHHYTRGQLLDWLQWIDPNGAYWDEAYREGEPPPLTHEEAADLAFEHVAETKETLEEMRRNARR